jgi:hypothetical protein
MSPIIVLAGVGLIAVIAVVTLTAIIIGIHKGDKNLYSAPRSNSDAFARRIIGGVRYYPENTDGDDK